MSSFHRPNFLLVRLKNITAGQKGGLEGGVFVFGWLVVLCLLLLLFWGSCFVVGFFFYCLVGVFYYLLHSSESTG